jgi:hypothetical protein
MKKLLTFVLSCAVAMSTMVAIAPLTACNSASLLAKVEDFQPVVMDALNLFCAIQPGDVICTPTFLAKINSDYTLATTLWSDYLTAVANGTETAAAYNILNAAFQVYEQDASLIFQAIPQLNSPTIAAIVAAAQVLLAAIEVMFPDAPAGVAVEKPALFRAHAVGKSQYTKAWLSGWISDFNQKIDVAQKAYPGVKLHKVHLHNVRLGVVKLGW